MRIHLLIVALLLAQPAHAGAWMRDAGTGFLSFSGTIDQNARQNGSLYVEYGLRPKLTLGLKADLDMMDGAGSAYAFVRKPVPTGARAYKLAYQLGIGGTVGDRTEPLLLVGLSYGRGLGIWEKSGWLAIDATVEWNTSSHTATAKLDSTLGLTLNDRFKVMLQVFHTDAKAFTSTTIAPSVIWTPKRGGANSYQLGVETDREGLGVKIGLWRSF